MTQKASSTFLQLPMAPYESIKETEKRSNSNKYTTKNNYISDYTTQNSNSITFRDKPVVINTWNFENFDLKQILSLTNFYILERDANIWLRFCLFIFI